MKLPFRLLSFSFGIWRTLVAVRANAGPSLDGNHVQDANSKKKQYNVLWLMIDDVSTERFPETGNTALDGLLPGIDQLKKDGAVYYSHFNSPTSICAPAQVALFSGMEPGDIGGQYQFSNATLEGKAPFFTVPPPEVEFVPEKLRSLGYYSVGGGKLDYQVGEIMPTFFNKILGGAFSDVSSYQQQVWGPAIEQGKPFFGMLNFMDVHQVFSSITRETPMPITNPFTGRHVEGTPFGKFGYASPKTLLFNTGPNGTAKAEVLVLQDLDAVDVVGYAGDFDETTLSHANGGVPGYLPDEPGIRSILAKEYDLIRNIDLRVEFIIQDLKNRGVYDDTLIALFGDHGSGTYRAKFLLEPQSVRTPLWIKYPTDMTLSANVKKGADGYNVDDRMTSILDLYPTTLSVIGEKPAPYMTGHALAGRYEVEEEREFLYALAQRAAGIQQWKSFAAFSKEFFYQSNLVTKDTILDHFEMSDLEEAALMERFLRASKIQRKFEVFPGTPLFDRVRKLMRVNALNASYPIKYFDLAADDAHAPKEVLYDLRSDPFGTQNLLIDYKVEVIFGNQTQKWGNVIEKVNVVHGPVDDSKLDHHQSDALKRLKAGLAKWIDGQRWVTPTYDFSDNGFAEENAMAEVFWPGGKQPATEEIRVDKIALDLETATLVVDFIAPTPGTMIRHAVVTEEDRGRCEQLGIDTKNSVLEMSPMNPGIPKSSYTSPRNGRTYTGFHYGRQVGYEVLVESLFGGDPTCNFFVSSDGTFMEIYCPDQMVTPFDTRDSTWNGTEWVGVDPETGEWLIEPITFWDADAKAINAGAFSEYIFGPHREGIFTGRNADGSRFSGAPSSKPSNRGYKPAPKYWATDEDPNVYPEKTFADEPWLMYGWEMFASLSSFRSVATPGKDNKGSFVYRRKTRILVPSSTILDYVYFDSFQYECLEWDVGTSAHYRVQNTTSKISIFTQGVRKGYSDSEISETTVDLPDCIGSCTALFSACNATRPELMLNGLDFSAASPGSAAVVMNTVNSGSANFACT